MHDAYIQSLEIEIAEYRFLMVLDDAIRPLGNPDDITRTAAALLGSHLGVNRCAYADVESDQQTFNLTGDYNVDVPSIVGRYNAADFGAEFLKLSRNGEPYIVEDAESDPRTTDVLEAYRLSGIRAVISIPVIKSGRFVAGMAVHQATPRHWREHEVKMVSIVANRCWESIERSRIARVLRESEAKFRTIANAVPQMVWSTRPDGFHDYFNQQWYDFTGVPEGSTDGGQWNAMFHPDDRARAWEVWHHSLATGETYEIQYRLRHRSGEYRWTLGRALPVRDESGNVTRWMGTYTDIHDQKIAEEELKDTSQHKDEFLAMLAHELRNPLAPICAAAQLLKIAGADENRVREYSDILDRQVKHMTNLVDDLLDVSRVTRGLIQLEKEDVDLKVVVNSAIEQARPLIEARQHEVRLRMASAPAFVFGDKTRLVQVVANLLNNAAKYTPQGGEIALMLEVLGTEAKISVSDNGNGISPTLLPHVFDVFTQGKRTPDRAQGGLGLGLALVKSMTTLHGGQVAASSNGPNKGSTFTITLPLLTNDEVRQADAAHKSTLLQTAKPVHLMIVDDNLDAARSLAALLETEGHHATVKEEARSALKTAEQDPAQVFILDIGLPGMDGYELARKLRARPETANAVLIALTGYGQEQDRTLSKAAGFDHHFLKPIDFQQLTRILSQVS
jgi:PAS domain S-box-containing protein